MTDVGTVVKLVHCPSMLYVHYRDLDALVIWTCGVCLKQQGQFAWMDPTYLQTFKMG